MKRSSLCGSMESKMMETQAAPNRPRTRLSRSMPAMASGYAVKRERGSADVAYQCQGETPHCADRLSTGLL